MVHEKPTEMSYLQEREIKTDEFGHYGNEPAWKGEVDVLRLGSGKVSSSEQMELWTVKAWGPQ